MATKPPHFSLQLVKWFCRENFVEEIQGNLHERFEMLGKGPISYLKYWLEVVGYLRLSLLKKPSFLKGLIMINPRITFRNLIRHGSNTAISLFGFMIGILSVTFLYFYIENELSYDSFHRDKDKTYRVVRQSSINGDGYDIGVTSGPFGPALVNDYPETVKEMSRVLPQEGLIAVEDIKIVEKSILFADPNFFDFFSFPLISGDKLTVLEQPNSVVISQEIAQKYFGDKDPIGQIIEVDNEYEFIITGLLAKNPKKSHLEFNMVFNLLFFDNQDWFHTWWNNGLMTYVKIDSNSEAEMLKTQLPIFMDKYFGEDFKKNGGRMGLTLQPLTNIHFSENVRFDRVAHGSKDTLWILSLVAISILFIACFNYINLSIAQSYKRAKEVGIRKVPGVSKAVLIIQFLTESIVIVITAMLLAFGLTELLLPTLNQFFSLSVVLDWSDPMVIYFALALIFIIVLTSGVYPSILLSSYQPLKVLKGTLLRSKQSAWLRKGLVVVQFSLSILLIISTFLIISQIHFMKNKPLGFSSESVLIIRNDNSDIRKNESGFIKALRAQKDIVNVSALTGEPGGFHDATTIRISGTENPLKVRTVFTDPEYVKVFNIPVIAGRDLNDDISTERKTAALINEAALAEIGKTAEEVIGTKFTIPVWDMERRIVGVVKDYHFTNLKTEIEPVMITSSTWHRLYAVKLQSQNINQTLAGIETIYNQFAPNYPISYYFQEDHLNAQYEEEENQTRVFSAFSGLSILLACLGIYGLAQHSAQQRQKELGIRKILGATISQIIGIISKEFILLVAIAAVIAAPITWYFIIKWLENFAYQISIFSNWGLFLGAGIITMLIALVTIAIRTFRTALANPIESIRYE